MSLILDGTNGLSDVDGSAATPAIRGSDANTGVFFDSDVVGLSTDGTERVRVDASGNVGIGTDSPSGAKVQIVGDNSALRVGSGARDLYVDPDGGGVFLGNGAAQTGEGFYLDAANNTLRMLTVATERARIDSSGNLLVGTTTQEGKVTVSGGSNDGLSVTVSSGFLVMRSRRGNDGDHIRFFNSAGTIAGNIGVTGSNTYYNTSSDYRLKHDIQPMTGALAKVAALKPVTYKWNANDSQSQGFIAHELQEVVPECVSGEKDAVDADGNPQYQGIDTSFLVATLTAAIQELKGINDAQAQIITALTARVEALEGAQA
jgi:hypothetical protein